MTVRVRNRLSATVDGGDLEIRFLMRGCVFRVGSLIAVAATAALLAGCGTAPEPKSMVVKKPRSKEYFAESEYGVKASPRVSNLRSGLPRGGGRDQLGKPYKVRGQWYYPKEVKNYASKGVASWYGDAFHGRLTANGEIYDMTHLTAAHPTMPLPSYARVTNTANGSSVIVRVNDRGPYSNGRIIDLSRRAAEMLDYTHSGTAAVKVEYVGRAPLDGQDDAYLVASYRPGGAAPDPSDGLPTGVMIAMNGSTPGGSAPQAAVPFPGGLTDGAPMEPALAMNDIADGGLMLPALGPIAPERPGPDDLPDEIVVASAIMSYAGEPVFRAARAFNALDAAPQENFAPYVAAGSFGDAGEADSVAKRLASYGRVEVESAEFDGTLWHAVNLYPRSGASVDDVLDAAWKNGARDAFVVRN